MTLALRSPNLVGALIPVDNAPVDALLMSKFTKYVRGLRAIEEARITKQVEADDILQKYEQVRCTRRSHCRDLYDDTNDCQRVQDFSIRQFLLTNLVRSNSDNSLQFRIPIKVLGASLEHMGDFPYKDPEEARYDGATLFIRGTKSRYVPDDVLPIIGRFFPRFELKNIDCGHWVISEEPEAFRQGKTPTSLKI